MKTSKCTITTEKITRVMITTEDIEEIIVKRCGLENKEYSFEWGCGQWPSLMLTIKETDTKVEENESPI